MTTTLAGKFVTLFVNQFTRPLANGLTASAKKSKKIRSAVIRIGKVPYLTSVTLQRKLDGVRNLKSIKCLSGYINKLRKKKTLSEDAKRSMQEIPLPVDLQKSRQEKPLIEDGNIKERQEKPVSNDHGNSNKKKPPTDDEAFIFGTQLLAELFMYSMSATVVSYSHVQSVKTKKEKEKKRLENEERKDKQIAILRNELTSFKEETGVVMWQMDTMLLQQVNNLKKLIPEVDQNRKAIQHLMQKGGEDFQNSFNIHKE